MPKLDDIIAAVCDAFDVTEQQLLGRGRSQSEVLARYAAVLLAREHTLKSWPEISRRLNFQDHSIARIRRREQSLRARHPPFGEVLDRLMTELAPRRHDPEHGDRKTDEGAPRWGPPRGGPQPGGDDR